MSAEISQLDQMREVAFGLGMGFGQAAMAEDDLDRRLILFDAFHRGFASVRLSIALKMRLDREARRPVGERDEPEIERDERPEPLEIERPERFDERERDRETERVSLPILLRTLGRVADDAETLLPQAAELPTLRELLARVKAQPAPAAPPSKPPPSPLRARLSGGTAALTLTAPPRPSPPGLPGLPPRRSTGPPRR